MCLLQTVLYGTYTPPQVPGRVVSFDDCKWKRNITPVRKKCSSSREMVTLVLKSDPDTWFTAQDVADITGLHRDTSTKVLNRLASEHLLAKRKAKLHPIGLATGLYKWMKKNA